MTQKLLMILSFVTASFIFTSKAESNNSSPITEITPTVVETATPELSIKEEINLLYNNFSSKNINMPSMLSFENAMLGYYKLENSGKIENKILSIVDFSLPSTEKRLWVLNMDTQKVLFNTYVSHGKNTGGNMATKFSNIPNSLQSSLGFFVTGETYIGGNGLSLFIDGMEKGINDNARERYVVIHGADYATPEFISRAGRLGRSYGCPALPRGLSKEIIETIKNKSCFFIYFPNQDYLQNSTFLDTETAKA